MAISSPGIGSNLDINGIVSQLMSIEQQPLVSLSQKEATHQAKLSAIGNLKSALSSFQSAVKALSEISKFQAVKVSAADATIASASGSSAAAPGTYSLEVTKLAQAQKLASAGQASAATAIGQGTITFDFGTIDIGAGSFNSTTGKYTGASFTSNGSGTKTITIDSSNSSLAGIRDAINKGNIGVTASIVNDGGASPYRLVLTETTTGKTSSMKISVAGDAALGTLLNHDPSAAPAGQGFSETVTAQNAEFKVDGIAVSKTTNTVTDVIEGVTLTLAKTNIGSPTNITVTRDTATVTASVNQFVQAFNQINQTLTDLSSYNATTRQGAILNGDATVRTIQTQLRSILTTAVGGDAGAYTLLSQVGVSVQKNGTLALDSTKLQKAVDSNFSDIAGLFAAVGKTSDSLVTYTGSATKTTVGAYALNITRLATQGKTTGQAGDPADLLIDASNDTLQVQVDGVAATITLTQKTYADAAALAAEVQSKINGASALSSAGASVKVTELAGVLTITSNKYGSASNASITGGNGQASMMGATPSASAGEDVAGTLNGVAATGSGQALTGATGSAAEGLKLMITGGSTGARGTVNFSKGYAYQFDKLVDSMLESTGPINSRTDGINASLKSLAQQKQRVSDRLVNIEKRYRAQFTALDMAMASMTKTSSFLQQQLDNLPKIE
ncbi:flagellar filament capping protein FliD [Noviherbaspirillum sedimenti]|uniref:Flagellar hook-associated protein 2 n=1 Tax=Noviherbaspirillum sedimenti TaxID=2320865 RepID=A0A3A3FY93_9BURK|nr:flagellar filament capping protein FliD [Noviherbaspirillum sedimenti]RJG01153.1 flagellar hook protein FliD [Noviherbaspirillum sedimenti]